MSRLLVAAGAVGLLLTSCSSDSSASSVVDTVGSVLYAPANGPTAPRFSQPIHADNSHADGVYYASVSEDGDPPPAQGSVVFELVQLFTGADCFAHFGTDDEAACVNDYGVETDPTSLVEVAITGQYITVVDSATQKSFHVSGDELYRLIQNQPPSAGAPAGFKYSGFGYFVTFAGGKITRLEQWWTP